MKRVTYLISCTLVILGKKNLNISVQISGHYKLELGLGSCRVGFVFGLNLNGLKPSESEPDLFNKRVDLNPTCLHKQVKRVGFRSPIYLSTYLIALIFNPKIDEQ